MKWCFLSFRGALGRQPFILALISIILANWLLAELFKELFHTGGPIYYDRGEADMARAQLTLDETFAGMILLWPNLAVSVKRWRDLGFSVRSFVIVQTVVLVMIFVAAGLGIALAIASVLTMIFAPTGFADRFRSAKR